MVSPRTFESDLAEVRSFGGARFGGNDSESLGIQFDDDADRHVLHIRKLHSFCEIPEMRTIKNRKRIKEIQHPQMRATTKMGETHIV